MLEKGRKLKIQLEEGKEWTGEIIPGREGRAGEIVPIRKGRKGRRGCTY